MASSAKKKPAKKPAKVNAQKTKTASAKASTGRTKPSQKAGATSKQHVSKKPAAKTARPEKLSKANGARKMIAGGDTAAFLTTKNHKERRLDPFTRSQKEKLLQLRDA